MPVQPTYPGVYIEEIPSGVHSITGVATSITAFIGRTLSGPTNVATTIESYADFERTFGGLWLESSLGYAVQDFYQNGGSTAIIVRLFSPSVADVQSINNTLQAVVNATDSTKPSTAVSLAAAMTLVAQDAQLKAGRIEGGNAAAAATAESGRPSTDGVKNAAQTAATTINQAAQAVASATDATSPSTPQSLSAAMQTVASTYKTDPAKTAAGLVASAAATAAGKKGVAVGDVQSAATDAATAISTATQAVVNVKDTTSSSTPQSLAAAMQTQANTDTTDPAKTAATLVATAAQAESTYTPTPASVKQAAQQIASAYTAPVTKSSLSVGGLSFLAYSEGTWGENLRAIIDFNVMQDVATQMNVQPSDLFNLTVLNSSPGGLTEVYRNLTLVESTRRIDKVLAAQSQLVTWNGGSPPSTADITALASARQGLPSSIPPTQQSIDDDVTTAQTQLTTTTKQLKNDKKAGKLTSVLQADQKAIDDATAALANAKTAMLAIDGDPLSEDQFNGSGNDVNKLGLYALEQVDLFNILCIPPYLNDDVDIDLISEAATYCQTRRAILLVDAPSGWTSKDIAKKNFMDPDDQVGTRSSNAALFFPRIMRANPLRNNQMETFAPCGAVAGIFARTDTQRGVWKAPAGIEASLVGVQQLSVPLTNLENGELNPLGINCLRAFPIYGPVVWGSRTLRGADAFADDYKYIPVRRLALFLEESLYRGTQWVVFEPNDEPLWAQIRLNVGTFMQNLFRQGAFQGQTPRDAYLVKCDSETTTSYDQDQGIVNILVGFAPLKPAEFVIIQIQQLAGQNQS